MISAAVLTADPPNTQPPNLLLSEADRRWVGRLHSVAPLALLVIGMACWAISLAGANPFEPTNFGLLHILGPWFDAAVVAVCASFALEFFGSARGWVLALPIIGIVALLHASPPIILHTPEYDWTYKHFGVANALSHAGRVTDPTDIYQLWPTFFALMGQLGSASGVDLVRVGAWSSFAFGLIDGLIVYSLIRQVRTDRRTALLGVFLFEAAMWPDTNYFSPQAFAFALSLGFWYLLLRFCIRAPEDESRSRNPLARRVAAYKVVATPRTERRSATNIVPIVAIALVFFAITASHQLSPYMLILGVAALTAFDLVRPRWLVLLLAAIAVAYFVPNASEVTSQYKIFNGLNVLANASGNAVHAKGSTGQTVSAAAARFLTFTLWISVAAIAIRRRRNPEGLLVPLLLGLTPFGILVAGNYGGEAIYRVILFSLPWFACIIVREVISPHPRNPEVPRSRLRRLRFNRSGGTGRRRAACLTLTVLAAALTIIATEGAQGAYSLYAVSPLEIQASEYFYAHAPAGASLSLLIQDFPTRLSGAYTSINHDLTTDPALIDDDHGLANIPWNATALSRVKSDVLKYRGTAHFLVITSRMTAYLRYFGIRTPAAIGSMEAALDHSPQWSIWYHNADTTIYRLRGSDST